MNPNVSRHDRALSALSLCLGSVVWLGAFVLLGQFGGAKVVAGSLLIGLLVIAMVSLSYVFARSAVIAHLRGHGVVVSEWQLPELYQHLLHCCETLGVSEPPGMYVINGNGALNAFATWFLGRQYVVLLSSVVDAVDGNPGGVRFYIGHEIGHLQRHDRALVAALRAPALVLPLLGAAYSRARETTCDRHGRACCDSGEQAARAVAILSAGAQQWARLSLDGCRRQAAAGRGFWMSFHELTASYPWTAKRIVRALDEAPELPGRHPLAFVLAAFVPYAGRVPAGIALLMYVYVVGIAAAIAVPGYQHYRTQSQLTAALNDTRHARDVLAARYSASGRIPATLAEVDVPTQTASHVAVGYEPNGMKLTLGDGKARIVLTPFQQAQGVIGWRCAPGAEVDPKAVPFVCRSGDPLP